jgi:5'-methylthioadenosine phosphorylase
MRVDVGIIGGTGVGERLIAMPGVPLFVPTAQGGLRGKLIECQEVRILAISRHSSGHKVPPHRVGYKAMALGLKQLGVKACVSTAAVGSLRREWGVGTLVACSDFLDLTARNLTLFDDRVVHTDFSEPFSPRVRQSLLDGAQKVGANVQPSGVYINANGPRFETFHEIDVYRKVGDVVGMTAATEAIVMREAGVPYGCLAIVSNLAAGLSDEPLNHGDVSTAMQASADLVEQIVLAAAVELGKPR